MRFFISTNVIAQPELKRGLWTTHFYKDKKRVDGSIISFLLSDNKENQNLFDKGVRQEKSANYILGLGGFFMGWTIGNWIGGGDLNYLTFGIGVANVGLIGIPMSMGGRKKITRAIDVYNTELIGIIPEIKAPNYKLFLVGDAGGVGLMLTF